MWRMHPLVFYSVSATKPFLEFEQNSASMRFFSQKVVEKV
jgi:hypothetical protein